MASSNWQHKINGVNNRHLHMLKYGILTDCTFLVGHGNDQKQIAAHKLILASASPVFETMFYGNLPQKDKPIPIPGVRPSPFKNMLVYIYTDQLNIKSLEKCACGLYYLADKYMLPDLAKRCIEYLTVHINPKNVCLLYEFANLFNLKTLKERCMQVLICDTENVLQHPNFLHISMRTLMDILDQNTLSISEFDLFYALERFAEKRVLFEHSNQDSASVTSNDEINNSFYDFLDYWVNPNCFNNDNQSSPINTGTSWGYVPQHTVPNSFGIGSTHGNQNSSTQEITVTRHNPPINKREFRCAVKKIRFLTMTPQEFAKGPANSKLLKQNDILTFFKIICHPHNNKVLVPEGFSNSRTKRILYNPDGASSDKRE